LLWTPQLSQPSCVGGKRHNYKIHPSTDHRAKFHAGRPTHLGDLALKKIKKTSGLKHKSAPQAIAFKRTN